MGTIPLGEGGGRADSPDTWDIYGPTGSHARSWVLPWYQVQAPGSLVAALIVYLFLFVSPLLCPLSRMYIMISFCVHVCWDSLREFRQSRYLGNHLGMLPLSLDNVPNTLPGNSFTEIPRGWKPK